MLKNTINILLFILILLLGNFHVLASSEQEKKMPCHSSNSELVHNLNKATAIKKTAPKYPKSAARKGQEGWVRLSFVIKEDGSVDLPLIEDSSGIKSFEKAARKAIKSWKFDPATRDGKTIEQCQNSVQLDFKMNKVTKGASRKFVRQYKKIINIIDENDLVEAKTALHEFSNKPRQNFYEDKFFFSLKAKYYQATGDKRQELANLKKLIPQGRHYLPKESYAFSIVRAFQLALLNNELSSALYFFDKLNEAAPKHESIASITPYIEKINTLINSPEHIYVAAQINSREHWDHYLARNSFTFTDISDDLKSVDIRCDNHFSTYPVEDGRQWNIPESWGDCKIFVYGKEGAKFNLVEVAADIS